MISQTTHTFHAWFVFSDRWLAITGMATEGRGLFYEAAERAAREGCFWESGPSTRHLTNDGPSGPSGSSGEVDMADGGRRVSTLLAEGKLATGRQGQAQGEQAVRRSPACGVPSSAGYLALLHDPEWTYRCLLPDL